MVARDIYGEGETASVSMDGLAATIQFESGDLDGAYTVFEPHYRKYGRRVFEGHKTEFIDFIKSRKKTGKVDQQAASQLPSAPDAHPRMAWIYCTLREPWAFYIAFRHHHASITKMCVRQQPDNPVTHCLAKRTILSENQSMTAQRADAAARRALILDAADHVFGQHGVTAPLDLVVERAQVGRATLYRNFPDRTALIQALLQRTVDRIRRQVEQLGDRDDALFEVFEGMAQRIIDSPALADYWRAVDSDVPSMRAARETVRDLLEEPIARAKAAGLCRADLEKTDISLISGMLGAALRGKTRDERAQLAGRALQLLRGGLQGAASEAR
ncbi:hypothetical protein SMG44B_40454 [Stenotrophomonas maltophilia]